MARSKTTSRPAADETCTLTRTVERAGKRLAVWTCSAPTPIEEGPTGRLRVALLQLVERVGRRKWKFVFVDPDEARREDAWRDEPGWWFYAMNPDPEWISNDAVGPYETLEAAKSDARIASSASTSPALAAMGSPHGRVAERAARPTRQRVRGGGGHRTAAPLARRRRVDDAPHALDGEPQHPSP